jgi:hypothetical protein
MIFGRALADVGAYVWSSVSADAKAFLVHCRLPRQRHGRSSASRRMTNKNSDWPRMQDQNQNQNQDQDKSKSKSKSKCKSGSSASRRMTNKKREGLRSRRMTNKKREGLRSRRMTNKKRYCVYTSNARATEAERVLSSSLRIILSRQCSGQLCAWDFGLFAGFEVFDGEEAGGDLIFADDDHAVG